MAQRLPTVREQIDSVREKLVTEGKLLAPDAEAAARAAAVPTFSEGTAALDERTGQPVVPSGQAKKPSFTDGGVQIPAGTETTGAEAIAGTPVSKEAILAEHQARIAAAEGTAQSPAAPATQAAGAQAAEAAAEQIADAFADYDEFEFEDPDLEQKIPIRVPKQYLETVKRGYGRRAALDRALTYAKDADPVLRQMIEDGRIRQILPLIQAAINDQHYGEYVTKGYDRLRQGLPLIEQARLEAAAAGAEAPAQVPAPAYDFSDDPFFAERVAPLMRTVETLQQRLDRQEQERSQQVQAQQEQQRLNQQRALEMQSAHQDLARAYPDQCRPDLGPQDPFYQKALRQAREAGYIDAYGVRAGLVFGGQLAHQIELERVAATSSPAAETLRQVENKNMELARQQAAGAARTVGGGSAMPAPPPAPLPRPTSFNADGSLKTPQQILVENQAWLSAQRATA